MPTFLGAHDIPEDYRDRRGAYVDLVTGEWTHLRVTFNGKRAQLYVNRAAQPVLIVNDLKQSPAAGGVALWIGSETEAFFRNLKVIGD